jgi:hypothetical protein
MTQPVLQSQVWLLSGMTGSQEGILQLADGRLAFMDIDGQTVFDVPLSEVREVEFPWYYFVDFKGACGEASGSTPNMAQSTGMQPFQQASVNGGPVENCVIANDGAKIFGIELTKTTGIYTYQIAVDGQGPSGIGSGYIHLAFTDESGDTYYLKIYSSTREKHIVDYNSSKPNIVKIWWSDHDFDVPGSASDAKPSYRVASPA